MKGSCTLVASMLAASTVALSSSSSPGERSLAFCPSSNEVSTSTMGEYGAPNGCASSDKEKFAPRFDGLRFIETLITAHR